MLHRQGACIVLWEVTFHSINQFYSDDALVFVEWKRGKRKDRRGLTKRVVVQNGIAAWEETVKFYGTVHFTADKGVKEKDLRIRIHKAQSNKERRIGAAEVDISQFVQFSMKDAVACYQRTVLVPIKLSDGKEKHHCTLKMTVKTQPPSGPVAWHEIGDDSASNNISQITTSEVSDTDDILTGPFSPMIPPILSQIPSWEPPSTTPLGHTMQPIPSAKPVTRIPVDRPQRDDFQNLSQIQDCPPPKKTISSCAVAPQPPPAATPLKELEIVSTPSSPKPPQRPSPEADINPLQCSQLESRKASLEKEVLHKDDEIRRLKEQLHRQKQENDYRILVEAAVLLMPPKFLGGIPVSSILVYEALSHWQAFELSADRSSAPFHTITGSLSAMTLRKVDGCPYYCLSTAAILFLMVQQEFPFFEFDKEEINEVSLGVHRQRQRAPPVRRSLSLVNIGIDENMEGSPAAAFVEELHTVAIDIYKHLMAHAKEQLSKSFIIQTLFDVDYIPQSNSVSALKKEHPVDRIIEVFDAHLQRFDQNHVPLELRAQFFVQLYLTITAIVTHALLDVPKLCTVGHGIVLKQKAAALERWALRNERNGMKLYGAVPSQLREIANLLILTNKEQLLTPGSRQDICPSLSEDLIARLLENYTPDEYDPVGFPYAKVRALKYRTNAAGHGKSIMPDLTTVHVPSLWSTWLCSEFGCLIDGRARWSSALMQDINCIPKELRDNAAFAFLSQ